MLKHQKKVETSSIFLNWSGNALIMGLPPQHRLPAQRWVDGINMRPNAAGTFIRHLAGNLVIQKVCLGFCRIHKNVDKKIFVKI